MTESEVQGASVCRTEATMVCQNESGLSIEAHRGICGLAETRRNPLRVICLSARKREDG